MTEYNEQRVKEALAVGGTNQAMADMLGVNERTMRRWKAKLALSGYSPEHDMTRQCPDGFKVKGVSSLYNKDGELSAQWIKTSADHERRHQMMLEAVEALKEEIPRVTIPVASTAGNESLLNVYTITDHHLGLLSWGEETGEDYDTDIAEELLVSWFARAIAQSPPADGCVFAQIGDYLHWDGMDAVTPASKHLLDADTRFSRLVRVAIRVTAKIIEMLATKYKSVKILMCEGNHDPASSVWLRELFSFRYADSPSIYVETRPDPYYCHEHGKTSIFWHHGHKHKMIGLDAVFVAKFRDVFGRTSQSYAHTGHLHHRDVKETNLMIVEQHRTLAAADAYASRGGWMSGRSSTVITYHKTFGEVGRITISPEMLH